MKVLIAEPREAERLRLAAMVWAVGDASVILVARGSEAIRTVLDEQPDVVRASTRRWGSAC